MYGPLDRTQLDTCTRYDSYERVIRSPGRHTTQQTNMHALGGIRIRDPNNQVAVDLRIRFAGTPIYYYISVLISSQLPFRLNTHPRTVSHVGCLNQVVVLSISVCHCSVHSCGSRRFISQQNSLSLSLSRYRRLAKPSQSANWGR